MRIKHAGQMPMSNPLRGTADYYVEQTKRAIAAIATDTGRIRTVQGQPVMVMTKRRRTAKEV